jgi:nucleotidyltransferase/DNA polymerase involved in DNA repair
MGFVSITPDRALLQLPLEGAESLTLNAVPYRPGMVGTYASRADLLRVGLRPTSFATLVLPSDAVEKLLKYADFSQVTRSRTGTAPVSSHGELEQVSLALLEPLFPVPRGIRLLGVTLSALNEELAQANAQLRLMV